MASAGIITTISDDEVNTSASRATASALLESGKYSDLTIKCDGREWHVHKSVVCIQSDYFASACDKNSAAAELNVIDLSEDNEYVLEAMLRYLYYGDYDLSVLPSDSHNEAILLHVHVFATAHKYFISPLGEIARGKARKALSECEEHAFIQAVNTIYTKTAEAGAGKDLRNTAVSVAKKNALRLFRKDSSGDRPQCPLIDTPEFLNDLILSMGVAIQQQALDFEATRKSIMGVDKMLTTNNTSHNATVSGLQAQTTKMATDNANLTAKIAKLEASNKALLARPKLHHAIPNEPRQQFDDNSCPIPLWYKCPNCNTQFCRVLCESGSYTHSCYSSGLVGKKGVSTMSLSVANWRQFMC